MEKTVLVELTSKQIKLAEGIVLFALFVSLLAGFGPFTSPFSSVWDSFFLRYCVSSLFVWCEPIAGGCTDNGSPLPPGKGGRTSCHETLFMVYYIF